MEIFADMAIQLLSGITGLVARLVSGLRTFTTLLNRLGIQN